MILALEGVTAVGKSTVAGILAERLRLPVFCDPVRHGELGDLTRWEMFLTGNQCNLTLTWFSGGFDFISDRWCLSSFVYDVWRNRDLLPIYRDLLPRYARADAVVYLLRTEPNVAFARMLKRNVGPVYTLAELDHLDRSFGLAALLWARLGGSVRTVDSTDPDAAASVIAAERGWG